jgi:hypothetical protein
VVSCRAWAWLWAIVEVRTVCIPGGMENVEFAFEWTGVNAWRELASLVVEIALGLQGAHSQSTESWLGT